MKKIKIAIIDSELLARHALSGILQDNEFEVLAVSGDVDEALNIASLAELDVLVFNIEGMNSEEFSTFVNLRRQFPHLPIVILAKRTEAGAEAAITALKLGAVDVITKPRDCTGLLFARRHLSKRVSPIVQSAADARVDLMKQLISKTQKPYHFITDVKELRETEFKKGKGARVVVIGSCTGGPAALFSLIPALPKTLRAPVIVAQHFPKKYTRMLARELNKVSSIKVREAHNGVELEAGSVWIAPGGMHVEVCHGDLQRMLLRTHKGPRQLGYRPSIDTLFRSAVGVFGSETLGIVLSGIGKDGVTGAKAIRDGEGQLLVQKPEQALAAELPLTLINAGLVDQYYSIEELVFQIIKRSSSASVKERNGGQHRKINRPKYKKESVLN